MPHCHPTQRSAPNASVIGIELGNASLAYGPSIVFDALSLRLVGGEVTCLLGPSGVGKSSLLRLLAGLVPMGDTHIHCSDDRPLAGRIAYMAQQDLLFPWLNVLENVTLGSRLRAETPDTANALRLLKGLGLCGHECAAPATLSGGMRQRVALARTLFEDKPVVLMDEPFSALDALTRFQLQALACDVLRGHTVLLVTHDPNEALRIGHRIHVMTGAPAVLGDVICPPGDTPRDPADEGMRELHQEILQRLGLAA